MSTPNLGNVRGVNQCAVTSYVRDYLAEKHGVNTSDFRRFNFAALFTDQGRAAMRELFQLNKDAGATVGGTGYGFTNFRACNYEGNVWEHSTNGSPLQLSEDVASWNRDGIAIAKEVYGDDAAIAGYIASIGDSAGGDDAKIAGLSDSRAFHASLHRPQIEVLADAGVDVIWAEAIRHRAEGEAIASVVGEYRLPAVISFEAHHNGLSDPNHRGMRFSAVDDALHEAARGEVEVVSGVNCIGTRKTLHELMQSDNVPVVVYPNQMDTEGTVDGQPIDRERFDYLAARGVDRTPDEDREFSDIREALSVRISEFEDVWQRCLEDFRVRVIGTCCGGTPDHVRYARAVYDQTAVAEVRAS